MKTNVTLVSPDRDLFGERIRQTTKPNQLCLTDLQRVYDENREINGWKERRIRKILSHADSPINTERIYYVLKERGHISISLPDFIKLCDEKTLIKILKTLKLYKTTGRGDNRLTYAHPDIFVLVSLELNPMLYGKTVVWLSDSLVIKRIFASNLNVDLKNRIACRWFSDKNFYRKLNIGLNYAIFGKHKTGIRDYGTEKQLADLEQLQSNLCFLIDGKFVKTERKLLLEIRKEYVRRHLPNHRSFKNKKQIS